MMEDMNPTTTPRRSSARQRITLSAAQRRERCDLARWALEHGRPLTLDGATVILAVRQFECEQNATPRNRWTSSDITSFIWGSAVGWCSANETTVPVDLAESLWTYLAFLEDTGQLSSGSSRSHHLLAAVEETAGLDHTGRRLPPKVAPAPGVVRGLRRTGTEHS